MLSLPSEVDGELEYICKMVKVRIFGWIESLPMFTLDYLRFFFVAVDQVLA